MKMGTLHYDIMVRVDMKLLDIFKMKLLGLKRPGKVKFQPNPWGFFDHD